MWCAATTRPRPMYLLAVSRLAVAYLILHASHVTLSAADAFLPCIEIERTMMGVTSVSALVKAVSEFTSRCSGRCVVAEPDRYNYNCHPCRRVKQRLCNYYHGSDTRQPPAIELIARLVYEIKEGVIPASSVMRGTWLRQ